jgi:hypothetical protein
MRNYVKFAKKFGLNLTDNKYLKSKLRFMFGDIPSDCSNDYEYYGYDVNECELTKPLIYPFNFVELDDFIIQNCPNIGIILYKELYNVCVKLNKGDEYDDCYECGQVFKTYYCYFVCDVEKLYDFLLQNQICEKKDLL